MTIWPILAATRLIWMPNPASSTDVEASILEIGRTLQAGMGTSRLRPARAVDERAMRIAARDRELQAALFRLVDVTPACRTLDDVGHHLAGLIAEVDSKPASLEAAMKVAHTKAGRVALGAAVAAGVRHMAHRFIAGEDAESALRELGGLWKSGIGSSVDLLGEATVTAAEADAYAARCLETLETLSRGSAAWPERRVVEQDSHGAISRVNLSVKVSALTPILHPEAPERGREDAAKRLRPLLRRARELGAHLHVDMESLDSLETTLELVLELLADDEFGDGPSAGLVVQAYLRDSPEELERILSWAGERERRPPLTIRLVKGAYWDHESAEAQQRGWSVPVFEDRAECDRNFEALTRRLLDARIVRPAIASHNLRSLAHAIAYARATGLPDPDLELQVLRGLGDELAESVAALGLRARVYSPIGDLVAGMAYLVRRLLENTSNESFLSAQAEDTPIDELLAAP
jgi:RHH-type proline utilization regulon transcriptional repressor/proline dehydrogenase/delta 1-pyrroline-5-carboxylate dehydrogenase